MKKSKQICDLIWENVP